MPWKHTGSKIAARHRERLAVVYVRQSTRQQVVGHQESTRLQYALVDRAVALGWEASRVVLIDDDLGKSGSSASIGLASSAWSQRSRWGMSAWSWAPRCRVWHARGRTGTSYWSCARWAGRCWRMPTACTTRPSTTTGCCWG